MRTALALLGVGVGGYLLWQWYQQRQLATAGTAAALTVANVTAANRTALLAQGWTIASNGSLLPPLPAIPSFSGYGYGR